jgi:predicted SnoaL-like aldol condensation-catalyzing enzyme
VSFATLDDLFAFLREQAGLVSDGEHTSLRESVYRAITRNETHEKGAMIVSIEDNKEVVRRWNSPEEQWALELLDEGYAHHSGTTAPWATTVQGLDEVKARADQRRREHPTAWVAIEDMIAEGDKVAVRMTFYRGEKPWANAMAFYRLKGGKIVDDWYCRTFLEE